MNSAYSEQLKLFKSLVKKFILLPPPQQLDDSNCHVEEFCRALQDFLLGQSPSDRSASLFLDLIRYTVGGRGYRPDLTTFKLFYENVYSQKKVSSNLGRIRLFLRMVLNSGKIGDLVIEMKPPENTMLHSYPASSVFRDPIAYEVFSSALLSMAGVKFKLDVSNSSLLDFSWEIAECRSLEAVPANRYGFGVERVDDFLFVGRIYDDCVLVGKIDVGDMIDEIFDQSVRDVSDQIIDKHFKRAHREPLRLKVLKYQRKDGTYCRCLNSFIQRSVYAKSNLVPNESNTKAIQKAGEIDIPAEALLANWESDVSPAYVSGENSSYEVFHIASVNLGRVHTTEALTAELNKDYSKVSAIRCRIQFNETSILILPDSPSDEILLTALKEEKNFVDIPCCGRSSRDLTESKCTFGYVCRSYSDEFFCHIFQSNSPPDVVRILCTLAQGFERTAWLF